MSVVTNPDLFAWLCPLDEATRNQVFDFGKHLEAQGVSNKVIVDSYRQICAKTFVTTSRLKDHEVYSYTRSLKLHFTSAVMPTADNSLLWSVNSVKMHSTVLLIVRLKTGMVNIQDPAMRGFKNSKYFGNSSFEI
ncbi:uncharacterized protein LOC124367680 [Homalodisca vitripennis]|uniref:uncharacterized protein LOC124367680 n=1 Tax=Homalodisca vitripennis TaxID=197043 RepID=UPI001EECC66D|nr:uncharacterized protein LOC124367680 [Homalodisca vitripennis]